MNERESRRFFATVIGSGLETGVMSPDDIFRYVTMDVLALCLPVEQKKQLIAAALQAISMDSALILDTIGIEILSEFAPIKVLWECVAGVATQALGGTSTERPQATLPRPTPDPSSNRKPNRSSRIGRVRAGATSRSFSSRSATPPPDDSDFEGATRVGTDPEPDYEEANSLARRVNHDDLTAHGKE